MSRTIRTGQTREETHTAEELRRERIHQRTLQAQSTARSSTLHSPSPSLRPSSIQNAPRSAEEQRRNRSATPGYVPRTLPELPRRGPPAISQTPSQVPSRIVEVPEIPASEVPIRSPRHHPC